MEIQSTFNSFSTRINFSPFFENGVMRSPKRRNISEFTQQDGRKKRTQNTDFQLTFIFSVFFFYKKICLKESEVWRKVIHTKLLSRLSHKVCRLLPSPVLLRTLQTFRFKDENDSRDEVWLVNFSRVFSKNNTPKSLIETFFTRKVSTVIFNEGLSPLLIAKW